MQRPGSAFVRPQTLRHNGGGGSILLGLPGLLTLVGCSGGNDDSPTPQPAEQIFNGDMLYETQDGDSFYYQGVHAFRIKPNAGPTDCLMLGLETNICDYDGSASSLHMRSFLARSYTDYDLERTYELFGEGQTDGGDIAVHFTLNYRYLYTDGSVYTRDYTGSGTLKAVERFDETESLGLTLLGEFGDFSSSNASQSLARAGVMHAALPGEVGEEGKFASTAVFSVNVRVKGDYAYLVRLGDGLRIVNISDPAHMVEVGHADPDEVGAWYYNDIKLLEQGEKLYAAVADSHIGMVIYDVTDPTQPSLVSTFFPDLAGSGDLLNNHTIAIDGNIAYMANYDGSVTLDPAGDGSSGGLLIVDLSDPAKPVELGRWLTRELGGTFTHDLFVRDGLAYLASWEAGLVVLDVSNPSKPVVKGHFTYDRMTSHSVWVGEVGGRLVAAHGDEDFYSHLRMVDVDPKSPDYMKEIGGLMFRPQVSIHNVMMVGNEVIAAHYQDGVRIFDVSDPTQPRLSAWFNTWRGTDDPLAGRSFYEGTCGVDVVGNRIYVADIERDLMVLERTP